MWKQIKTIFAVAIYSVVLITIILGVCEIALRFSYDKTPIEKRHIRLRENYLNMDFEMAITNAITKYADGLDKTSVRIRTDANGFVLPSLIHAKPDVTIAFLGGSSTRCGVVDETNRFPYLAGRILENTTGRKINSINSGVTGNHSLHNINLLINNVLAFKPDIAILHNNMNDLINLLLLKSYWNDHFRNSLIVTEQGPTLTKFAAYVRYSLLRYTFDAILALPAVEKAIEPLRFGNFDAFRDLRGKHLVVDPEYLESEYRMNLEMFIAVCQARYVTPVLLTEASRVVPDPEPIVLQFTGILERDYGIKYADFQGMHTRFNQVIREVGAELGVLVIDLERAIPKDSKHLADLVHYNDQGSKLAAQVIANELEPLIQKSK